MSANALDVDGSGIDAPSVERCSIQRLRGREVILMSKDVSPDLESECRGGQHEMQDCEECYSVDS